MARCLHESGIAATVSADTGLLSVQITDDALRGYFLQVSYAVSNGGAQ